MFWRKSPQRILEDAGATVRTSSVSGKEEVLRVEIGEGLTLSDKALGALAGLGSLPTLVWRGPGPTDAQLSALAPLALRNLEVTDADFTGAGLGALTAEHVEIASSTVGAGMLSALPRGLRTLRLVDCEVADAALEALASHAPACLKLERCAGFDAGLAALAGVAGVREVWLDGCAGVTDVAPLAGLPELEELRVAGTGISDGSVDAFAEHGRLARLLGLGEVAGVSAEAIERLALRQPLVRLDVGDVGRRQWEQVTANAREVIAARPREAPAAGWPAEAKAWFEAQRPHRSRVTIRPTTTEIPDGLRVPAPASLRTFWGQVCGGFSGEGFRDASEETGSYTELLLVSPAEAVVLQEELEERVRGTTVGDDPAIAAHWMRTVPLTEMDFDYIALDPALDADDPPVVCLAAEHPPWILAPDLGSWLRVMVELGFPVLEHGACQHLRDRAHGMLRGV